MAHLLVMNGISPACNIGRLGSLFLPFLWGYCQTLGPVRVYGALSRSIPLSWLMGDDFYYQPYKIL